MYSISQLVEANGIEWKDSKIYLFIFLQIYYAGKIILVNLSYTLRYTWEFVSFFLQNE